MQNFGIWNIPGIFQKILNSSRRRNLTRVASIPQTIHSDYSLQVFLNSQVLSQKPETPRKEWVDCPKLRITAVPANSFENISNVSDLYKTLSRENSVSIASSMKALRKTVSHNHREIKKLKSTPIKVSLENINCTINTKTPD